MVCRCGAVRPHPCGGHRPGSWTDARTGKPGACLVPRSGKGGGVPAGLRGRHRGCRTHPVHGLRVRSPRRLQGRRGYGTAGGHRRRGATRRRRNHQSLSGSGVRDRRGDDGIRAGDRPAAARQCEERQGSRLLAWPRRRGTGNRVEPAQEAPERPRHIPDGTGRPGRETDDADHRRGSSPGAETRRIFRAGRPRRPRRQIAHRAQPVRLQAPLRPGHGQPDQVHGAAPGRRRGAGGARL